jgi:hypothetical protein
MMMMSWLKPTARARRRGRYISYQAPSRCYPEITPGIHRGQIARVSLPVEYVLYNL